MNDTHDLNDFPYKSKNGAGTPEVPPRDVPPGTDPAQNLSAQSPPVPNVPIADDLPDDVPSSDASPTGPWRQSPHTVTHGQSAVADEEDDAQYAEYTELDSETFDSETLNAETFDLPAFDARAQDAGVTVPRAAPFKPLPQEDFIPPPPPNGRGSLGKIAPSAPAPHNPSPEHEMDLLEHLGELRTRLLHCICAVALMMVVTWTVRDQLLAWFAKPIVSVLKEYPDYQLITIGPGEGFMIYMQITFAAALLLTAPYVIWEMWRFVEPALTHQERRYTSVLVPFSITLFIAGCFVGYFMTPVFFRFFLGFQPPGSVANYSYGIAVTLLAKMLLVFGVCFQVPVITIFVNKTGLVSRNLLIEYWRHVVVVIFIVVSIITPTWDPVTLLAAAVPPCLLYGVSLWMVKWL